MATVNFDTLKFANRLKQAGVPDPQAEAEAEVMAEALQLNLKDLATQRDLHDLETRMRARIDTLEAKVSGDLTPVKWMLGWVLGGIVALVLKTFF